MMKLVAELAALFEWTRANPELAAAWDEAIGENTRRRVLRGLAAAQEAERQRLPRHLLDCGVGERTSAVIARGLARTRALDGLRAWLATSATFCLLLGRTGTGKSVAAASVLELAKEEDPNARATASLAGCEAGSWWRYAASRGLFVSSHALTASLHGDGELLDEAYRVEWLVIDDLGGEYADQADRWLSELDALLDARYEGRGRTVITSNMPAEEFRIRYGARISSRIRGDGQVVDCGTQDLRRREAARGEAREA